MYLCLPLKTIQYTIIIITCIVISVSVLTVIDLSSSPVFSAVLVTESFALYVCFVDRCLSFCTFSFGHCVVRSSSIDGF
jgi:hypothetical protein